jgi:pyruvate ferredoxin oxidoreductase delta subunit
MNRRREPRTLLGPVAIRLGTANTGSWRTQRPEVDFERCTKCGLCAEYCPVGVIDVRKDHEECVVIDWYCCKGCGICANVCPRQCVSMMTEIAQDAE